MRELETTAAEANEKLMQQWKLLQSKANATGSGSSQSLSISEQLKIQNLRDNSQRLRSLRFQRSQVELQLGTERKARVPMQISPEDEINSAIDQHPEVIALREQIRQCEIKVQKIQEIVKNKDAPQLVRLQNEKQYYSTAENQLRDKIKATELKRLKNLVTESSPSVKSKELEVQLQLIDQELKQLGETSAQLESSIAAANGSNGVELEIIRHEIDRQEKLADQLWKTIQELRIEERAEPRVALLSIPNSEVKLNRSTQLKTVAAASLIGCVIAILCVGYLEWASCIVRSPYDILKRARMRAFGFTGRKRRATVKNIASGADEIAAQLLLFTCENGKIPITFVSSPSDREPRSAVSVALAISLTQVGKSTLLIAFDRCNELRSDGDKTSSRGQDLIRGLSHPVAYSSLYGFDYVKMGSNQDNRNWTASKSLPMILKEVRNRYEAIVLLGPAVLTCPESVVLAKMAELTLLVGVMGASRSDELSASREQLESARSAILGTLVTPAFSDTLTLTPPVHDVHRKEHVAVPKEVDEVAILAELTGLTGLTGVTEMQGQIKQIDPAAAVKAPHKFKLSKQPIPRPQHRTTE